MARITSLTYSSEQKKSDKEILGFYNVVGDEFFLWSPKAGDVSPKETKQIISFKKEIAEQLYYALGKYINK
jgi:outer membrane phospholipase A